MIRIIIMSTFLILFLILTTPLMLIMWIIGHFSMNARNKGSLAIVLWGFRVILFLSGVKVTVIGEENVPKDQAVLYVGNHRSIFDVLLTYVRVPRPTGYVSKLEMKKVPLLNIWMKLVNCQFLDRQNIKEGLKTILKCIDLVKNGVSICIFPEGTRCKEEGSFLPFHDGSFKIAQKTGCPIVPFAINNSAAIFENQFPKVRKTHVVIRYGAPVYYKDLDKEQQKNIGETFKSIIMDMHEENKSLL